MKNNDSDGIIGLKIKFVVSIRVPIDIGHIDANGILEKDNKFYYFRDTEVQMQEVENNDCWYSISIQDANDLKNIAQIEVEEAACILGKLQEILVDNIAIDQWSDEKAPMKSEKYQISKKRFGIVIAEICNYIPINEFYEIFSNMKAHEIYEMCQSKKPSNYIDNM